MHLCLILDNSLPMSSKSTHNLTLLDMAKSALERLLISLSRRSSHPYSNIHLFITSSPSSPVSSYEHEELHLHYQLKNIQVQLQTNLPQTIQTALQMLGIYRVLTETETIMGYREGTIYEPALIFVILGTYITKQMTKKLQDRQKNFFMRSQYQLIFLHMSGLSITQNNSTNNLYQQQQQLQQWNNNNNNNNSLKSLLYELNFAKQHFITNQILMYQILLKYIDNYQPNLFIKFQNNQYLNQQLSSQFFINSQNGKKLYQILNKISNNKIINQYYQLQIIPTRKRSRMPLPFNIKVKENQFNIVFQSIQNLNFYVDFMKKYNINNSNSLPQDHYKIINCALIEQCEIQMGQSMQFMPQSYPIFYFYNQKQYLFGLFKVCPKNWQLLIYYAQFAELNRILVRLQRKQSVCQVQPSLKAYIANLPPFYCKFLQPFLKSIRLPLYNEVFMKDNQSLMKHNKLQQRINSLRRKMQDEFKNNLQSHKNSTSKCCPIYSNQYQAYSKIISQKNQHQTSIEKYTTDLFSDLLHLKSEWGIIDYLTISNEHCTPMTKQIEKYSMRKDLNGNEFNQNIPFQKGQINSIKNKIRIIEKVHNTNEHLISQQQKNNKNNNNQSTTSQIIIRLSQQNQYCGIKKNKTISQVSQINYNNSEKKINQNRQNKIKQQQRQIKINKQQNLSNQNQLLMKMNSIHIQKPIFMKFNPINLNENALNNQIIIKQYLINNKNNNNNNNNNNSNVSNKKNKK